MIGFKIKTRYVLVTSSPISTYMRCCQLYLEEVEGFEPPRDSRRLSVFKTDPFSQTWVYLHIDIKYNNKRKTVSQPYYNKLQEEKGPFLLP